MLTPTTRSRAWDMLTRFGLDAIVFRFWELPWKSPHPEIRGARGAILFPGVLPDEPIPFGLALAAASLEYVFQRLPHLDRWPDIPIRAAVRAVRQSLRVSNDEADMMEGALYGVEQLIRPERLTEAQLKRFLARSTAAESRALIAALPPGWEMERRGKLSTQLAQLEQTDYAPTPLINGDDLTDAGLKPGPKFKVALDQTYDAQLEGRITTRKDALEMAIGIAKGATAG
jgi:poly(A) polymerase